MEKLTLENEELRKQLEKIKVADELRDKRIADLEERVALYTPNADGDVQRELSTRDAKRDEIIVELEKKVDFLTEENDDRAQKELLLTLEVQNVPEIWLQQSHTDTAISIMKSALDLDVDEGEINDVQLIVQREGDEKRNGNLLLLKLRNDATRRMIIDARRKKNKLNGLRGIFLKSASGTEDKIYFNERLTVRRRGLLNEARKVRGKLGFKFLWIEEGRINMRRREGEKVFEIKSFSDFALLNT